MFLSGITWGGIVIIITKLSEHTTGALGTEHAALPCNNKESCFNNLSSDLRLECVMNCRGNFFSVHTKLFSVCMKTLWFNDGKQRQCFSKHRFSGCKYQALVCFLKLMFELKSLAYDGG